MVKKSQIKKIKYFSLMIVLLFLGMSGIPLSSVQAAVASKVPYSVSPILPENQLDKNLSYFNLRVSPGQEQVIEVEVKNTSDQPIEIDIRANSAMTNINGVIDYLPESKEFRYDKTLQYPFERLARVEPKVKVPAKESRHVPVTIKIPSTEFNGVILGGIEFIQTDAVKESAEESGSGMAINNKFRYIIPVKLSENDREVKPELMLNQVKASQVAFRNVINANLQNTKAAIVNDLAIESKVTAKGSSEVLYETKSKDMQMAPNSNFNFPIRLGSKPFKAGKYTLYLVATARDNQKWEFKKDFEITRKEADDYNKESAIELEEETNWILFIILGLIVVLVIIVIIFVILKLKKSRSNKIANKQSSSKTKKVQEKKRKKKQSKSEIDRKRRRK